ncbi:Septum formation initiator [Urinicoccus massiliensis]|uniref:Septum formation initiator n=1 Tax=Urinicoccus massiliensis TaxID=1723382 RepID=A0A8H2QXQ7_9FIRM|nr:septum formation initiator family protein [Urinicoccus massiliensis]VFB16034.1 Septum formation initiator [Urinicoccus massiliensis]
MNMKPRNKKINRPGKTNFFSLSLYIIWGLCALMLLLLMVNYLELEKLKNSIERQNVEISELKKTKDSISGQLAGIKSSDEVANIARYKLGMVYPDDEQVVYIQVDKKVAETDVKENVFLSPVISILKIFGANKGEGSL